LVILHVAAIVWYRIKKAEDLVGPMLQGDKEISGKHIGSRDDWRSRVGALVVLVLCGTAVAALVRWAQ
jgi:hypothetical protein